MNRTDQTVPSLQHLRQLENRLDKARLKSQEAEHICKVYEKIKGHLQEVGRNGFFENRFNFAFLILHMFFLKYIS